MKDDAEHRWLGYEPVLRDGFIAVCSCGWRSPAQSTAGVAGALLDTHRNDVRGTSAQGATSGPACSSPPTEPGSEDGVGS